MKKVAIIGFGFMGITHAKNVINSDNLQLCAIIDNRDGDIFAGLETTGNGGKIDVPLKELSKVPKYKTLEECNKKESLDAVIICLPLYLHYKFAKKALNLKLDVLLEKPFAPEVEQCLELIALAKANECILMVAHCVRFAPEWEYLAESIRDKRYGELKMLTMTRIGGEPTWGVWQNEEIKKTCGGSIMDLLIHDIDFSIHCLGLSDDVKVTFNFNQYWELLLKYKQSSSIVTIKGGFLNQNTAFSSEYVASFENASLRFTSWKPGSIYIGKDSGAETVNVTGDLYINELHYFSHCIDARCQPSRSLPNESMETIGLCEKVGEFCK